MAIWAGHSVEVLLKIYAKCIDGDDVLYRARIETALDRRNQPPKLRHVFDKNTRREPPRAVDSRTNDNGPSPAF